MSVKWDDGRVYGGEFRGKVETQEIQVESLTSGVRETTTRDAIYLTEEELPRSVKRKFVDRTNSTLAEEKGGVGEASKKAEVKSKAKGKSVVGMATGTKGRKTTTPGDRVSRDASTSSSSASAETAKSSRGGGASVSKESSSVEATPEKRIRKANRKYDNDDLILF